MAAGPESDIDAILGDDADTDRRAQLVAELAALQKSRVLPGPDAAELAAYLDGGLTQDETFKLQGQFATSASAQADLESAIALLDAVEKANGRPPATAIARAKDLFATAKPRKNLAEAAMARARELIAAETARERQPAAVAASARAPEPVVGGGRRLMDSIWQKLMTRQGGLAAGLACAAVLALVLWNPLITGAPNPATPPQQTASREDDNPSRQGVLGEAPGGQSGSTGWRGMDARTWGANSTWGAVAVSKAQNSYGVARNAASQDDAASAALASCAAQHATDCSVVLTGKGTCLAVASGIGATPTAAAGATISAAGRNALAACNSARSEIWPCRVQNTFCSDH